MADTIGPGDGVIFSVSIGGSNYGANAHAGLAESERGGILFWKWWHAGWNRHYCHLCFHAPVYTGLLSFSGLAFDL